MKLVSSVWENELPCVVVSRRIFVRRRTREERRE